MKALSLVDQIFGKLKVIREVESRKTKRMWECFCECGRPCTFPTDYLRRGIRTSCGYCDELKHDPANRGVGRLSLADTVAKTNFDQKLLDVALDAVKFMAQTSRRIYYVITGQKLMPKGHKAEVYIQNAIVGTGRWDGKIPWDRYQ